MKAIAALGSCLIGLFVCTGASPATPKRSGIDVLTKAVAGGMATGTIERGDGRRFVADLARARAQLGRLPSERRTTLQTQIDDAVSLSSKLTGPRARAIFGQLEVNLDWLASHGPPAPKTDVTDASGVVYRSFAGRGFEFHPLANFAALNGAVARRDATSATRLATALIDRGIPGANASLSWEYLFPYAGGRAPWTSGMAQAVAAQAFSRASRLVPEHASEFGDAARSAFRAIPDRLVRPTAFGTWIDLYSFGHLVVLNAQLQAAISVADYAAAEGDPDADALAASLRSAAVRALPQFDTGYWSYYALPRVPSSVDYHAYVIDLLKHLARGDARFTTPATNFARYETEAPVFRLSDAGPGAVSFWVSKPATVRVNALGSSRQLGVTGGWHTVSWPAPASPGVYPVSVRATDWLGNSSTIEALPLVKVVEEPKPKPKPGTPKVTKAATRSNRDATEALSVGFGLDQPGQASLAAGVHATTIRMTLVWPAGATEPDPGALTALSRLPSGSNLSLVLYGSPLPTDSAGRAALSQYAAALATRVPTLRDIVVGPAPGSAAAARAYEPVLAAVYDAVKAVAPNVRIDAALDGETAPKASLSALASTYRASGRTSPLLDALAFHPAAASGGSRWPASSFGQLDERLVAAFVGTPQDGALLAIVAHDIGFVTTVPEARAGLYPSPGVLTGGIDENEQAQRMVSILRSACAAGLAGVVFQRLVDGSGPGEQSGLYYVDGTPKASLGAVASSIGTASSSGRPCSVAPSASPQPAPSVTTQTTPAPVVSPPTTTTEIRPAPPTPSEVEVSEVAFPSTLAASGRPRVHLRCSRNCLYLVALRTMSGGVPVLARRGSAGGGSGVSVTLPSRALEAGVYRLTIWVVGSSDPGTISMLDSSTLEVR